MPIYEYQCTVCGHQFEAWQSIKDEALRDCPKCGKSTLEKLVSMSAFHLKGSGWYVTDFKNPPSKTDNSTKPQAEQTPEKTKESPETNKPKDESVSSKATPKTEPPSEKSS